MVNESRVKAGYERYGNDREWKNFQGAPMPKWEDLPEGIRAGWAAAMNIPINLDAREMEQVWHALTYAELYSGAGVPGHGQFMLIAKLAQALGLDTK